MEIFRHVVVRAFAKPENNDPYIGKWVGFSSNKESKDDRRQKESEPNDFTIKFEIKRADPKSSHQPTYTCDGVLIYSIGVESQESGISIEVKQISTDGTVIFNYRPIGKTFAGFYGTGMCMGEQGNSTLIGETVGFCNTYSLNNPGLVSANIELKKLPLLSSSGGGDIVAGKELGQRRCAQLSDRDKAQ